MIKSDQVDPDSKCQANVVEGVEIDPFLSQRCIAEQVGSSKTNILRILNELGYRRLCGLSVLKQLTDVNMAERLECAKAMKRFLEKMDTGKFVQNETWVYFSAPIKKHAYVG